MSLQDSLFLEQVEDDVTHFSKNIQRKRVLVFPPVNNYRRFLIHQLVQDQFADLHTFSIGQASARRTVVCYKFDLIRHPELNGTPSSDKSGVKNSSSNMGVERSCSPTASPENSRQRQVKSMPAVPIYRPPAARKVQNISSNSPITPESCAPKPKMRRPDRAVYVPKPRRSVETEGNTTLQDDFPSGRLKKERKLLSVDDEKCIDSCETSSVQKTNEVNKVDETKEKIDEFSSNPNVNSTMKMTEQVPVNSIEICFLADKETSSSKINSESMQTVFSNSTNSLNDGHCNSSNNSESPKEYFSEESLDNTPKVKKEIETTITHSAPKYHISDVLIISNSETKPQENIAEDDLTLMTVRPPEQKVKKVARTKSKPAAPPSLPTKLNRDECDWDSLFDDNGECLDPTLIDELTESVGNVTIEAPKNEYKPFSRPVEVSSDELAHVVEIYNFPSDFKTSDLAAVFTPWKNGGYELKWVDDTHCLGVFSSPLAAAEVLASDHPFVKTRPMSEATALSRTKARKSAEFLQPYKSRPETCAALARRLVTGALGVRLATARQEREHEKVLLREAKERRRLANKQREEVWEGIIAHK